MARTPPTTPKRQSGTVTDWDDDRGFGFIQPKGGDRLFFHISEVRNRDSRARVGDRVTYAIGVGRNGKPAAVDVDMAGGDPLPMEASPRAGSRPLARASYRVYAAGLLTAVLLGAVALDRAPIWLAAAYLVLGGVSAVLYTIDKRRAEAGAWRTPEATLHGVDLVGGIIGGLVAQHILRHKTSKTSYAVVTAAITGVHLVFLLALAAGSVSPADMEAILRSILGTIS